MTWVAVNPRKKFTHDVKLRIVCTDVDIEIFHVVGRTPPPVLRIVGHEIRGSNDRRFAILGSGRSIEVEAVQPDPRSIQHLPGMVFIQRLGRVWKMEIYVGCGPVESQGH